MSLETQHELPVDADVPPELTSAELRLSPVEGFSRGPSVFRFDASNILFLVRLDCDLRAT